MNMTLSDSVFGSSSGVAMPGDDTDSCLNAGSELEIDYALAIRVIEGASPVPNNLDDLLSIHYDDDDIRESAIAKYRESRPAPSDLEESRIMYPDAYHSSQGLVIIAAHNRRVHGIGSESVTATLWHRLRDREAELGNAAIEPNFEWTPNGWDENFKPFAETDTKRDPLSATYLRSFYAARERNKQKIARLERDTTNRLWTMIRKSAPVEPDRRGARTTSTPPASAAKPRSREGRRGRRTASRSSGRDDPSEPPTDPAQTRGDADADSPRSRVHDASTATGGEARR